MKKYPLKKILLALIFTVLSQCQATQASASWLPGRTDNTRCTGTNTGHSYWQSTEDGGIASDWIDWLAYEGGAAYETGQTPGFITSPDGYCVEEKLRAKCDQNIYGPAACPFYLDVDLYNGSGTRAIINGTDFPGVTKDQPRNLHFATESFYLSPPVPVAVLSASPSTITAGNASSLTWSCTNSTSASITGVGAVTPASAGSVSVSPGSTTGYTLTCSGSEGTATNSTTVTVNPALSDLVATNNGTVNTTVGAATTLGGTTQNIGAGSTVSSFSNYIIIYNDAAGTAWAYNDGPNPHTLNMVAGPLAPGAQQALSGNYTFTHGGVYYYRLCTDWDNSIPETNDSSYDNAPRSNCSAPSQINVAAALQPDLTPTAFTPLSVVAGTPANFVATLANTGTAITPAFSSIVYVCKAGDTACITDPMARVPQTIWQKVFAYFRAAIAEAATSIKVTLTGAPIAGGASGTQTGSYTFPSPGAYQSRVCADLPGNNVPEIHEDDNCANWQVFTVCPAGNTTDGLGTCTDPTPSVSCSVSATNVNVGDTVTYTAAKNSFATTPYSWLSPDSYSGSGPTLTRTFNAPGTYAMQVKATNTAYTNCSANVTVAATYCTVPPTSISIKATPSRVKSGGTSLIEWSAANIQGLTPACNISSTAGFSSNVAASGLPLCKINDGSDSKSNITVPVKYTILCSDGSSASTTVNIIPVPKEF